jgi:hypothetical protein
LRCHRQEGLTFAKRYAFCNAFGILTGDEDIDGAGTGTSNDPADKFEKAKKMILASRNVDGLIEYDGKVKVSKMSDARKKELHDLINSRVDELSNKK